MPSNRLAILLTAQTRELETGINTAKGKLEELADAAAKTGKESADALNKLSTIEVATHLAGLARQVGDLAGHFTEAAAKADDLEDRLRGAFGDMAGEAAKLALEIGSTPPFSAEDTAAAAETLQKFGLFSREMLMRIGDAAAATGQGFDGLAEQYGRFDKFGDSKSLRTLQKSLGASNQELQSFGAVLDGNGKILLDTEARIESARQAIERFTDAKFAGAMDRMADPLTKAQGQFELFKAEVGASVIELQESFGPALLAAAQNLRELPEGLKTFIGVGAEAVGIMGQTAGGAIEMAANLKLAGVSLAGVKSAASAAGAAILGLSGVALGLIAVMGSAAVGLALYTAELQTANKAAEDLLKIETERARWLNQSKDVYGKTAAEIKAMGKTSEDVSKAILAMQDQAEQARARGDDAAAKRHTDEIARLQGVKKELAVTEGAKQEAVARTELSEKEAAAAKKRDDQEARKREEEARKEALEADLHAIELGAANRSIDKKAQIAGLEEVLEKHKLTADERRKIESKIAGLQGQLADEAARAVEAAERKKAEAAKKAEAERKKLAEKAKKDREKEAEDAAKAAEKEAVDLRKLREEHLGLQRAGVDNRIQDLERQAEAGKNVEGQLIAALRERLAIEQQAIRERADADKAATDSDESGSPIIDLAEDERRRARKTELRDDEITQKRRVEAARKEQEAQERIKRRTEELAEEERRKKGGAPEKAARPQAEGAQAEGTTGGMQLSPEAASAIAAAVQQGVTAALSANPQKLDVKVDVSGAELDSKNLTYTKSREPGYARRALVDD